MLPDSIEPLAIGLVVTCSPSLKLGDPLIAPVILPSLFFLHLVRDGTPFGKVGATTLGAVVPAGFRTGILRVPAPRETGALCARETSSRKYL